MKDYTKNLFVQSLFGVPGVKTKTAASTIGELYYRAFQVCFVQFNCKIELLISGSASNAMRSLTNSGDRELGSLTYNYSLFQCADVITHRLKRPHTYMPPSFESRIRYSAIECKFLEHLINPCFLVGKNQVKYLFNRCVSKSYFLTLQIL